MHRTWLRRVGLVAAGLAVALAGLIAWQWMAPQHWALRLMLVRAEMQHWNPEWTLPGTRLEMRLISRDFWRMHCFGWIPRASIADQFLLAQDLLEKRDGESIALATELLQDAQLRAIPSPTINARLLILARGSDWAADRAWSCLFNRSPEARPHLRKLLLDDQLPLRSIESRLRLLNPNDGDDLSTLLTLARRSDNAVRQRVLRLIGVLAKPELRGTDAIQNLFRAEYQAAIRQSLQPVHHATANTGFMSAVIRQRWLRLNRDELAALVEGDGPYARSALEALIGDSEAKRKASIPSLVRDPTLPVFCRWQVALAASDPRPMADDLAALAEVTLALPDEQRHPLLARLRALMEFGEWSLSMRGSGMMIDPGTTPPALLDTLGADTCARLGLPAPGSTSAAAAP